MLIEFWDFCRPNSIRTLPYLKTWDARYRDAGLRVVGVHAGGFAPSEVPENVEAAVARLEIAYPVLIDNGFELWQEYENLGWPARYLFNAQGMLVDYHYGEGAYADTEMAIAALLGLRDIDPVTPLRPEDAPHAILAPQSEDVEGAWNGPYEAGSVWGVFDGAGVATVNGNRVDIHTPGAVELLRHEVSTSARLELSVSDGLTCLATCFAPGLARA